MKTCIGTAHVLLLVFALMLLSEQTAHAYLDAAGSMIGMMIQVIIGGVVASLVAIRLFWARITGALRRWIGSKPRSTDSGQEAEDGP